MYFHRISDNRLTGVAAPNFNMFQKLCGEDALANVAIVITRWDEEDEDVANARLETVKTKLAEPRFFDTTAVTHLPATSFVTSFV
ncbi:Nucleoside triphosphate hydrolase protein [Mycena sanguinolenta]|uniref:Nucleoside triphosphate hydrolase protein n=1 Tax=Mycena sanguinolenta TaxID=230812 RepID=A0A8H6Y4S9_9AGAR|nr:Nucleoside triphosphate hydrolase protein [Mycena sanguinolenta]